MATNEQIAWAAGIFEGEGCISLMQSRSRGSNRTRPWVRLSVQMTDRDVIEHLYEVVAVGGVSLHHRANRPKYKDCWAWQASARDDVIELLTLFLPWLGNRRTAKANEALELLRATGRLTRQCEYCGDSFESYRGFQRFCSKKHQWSAWYEAKKAEGHTKEYAHTYYLNNREAALNRAKQQRERAKQA